MTCANCRAPVDAGSRFCGACGKATLGTEPSQPAGTGEPPVAIGREIAGRYRILAKLGEGGMGAVYKAEQISLKRTVAVKLLRPEMAASALLLRRFNAEAEAVAKLSHPNTVNIYDFGVDADGALFIAMEYIEGRSLRAVVHHEAPLSPRRALAIAAQIADSLADAHARAIVHRDLKPDNVMLQERGRERDVVRVLDFGIAKLRDEGRQSHLAMTQAGDMLGTPQYMAPEQIRGERIDGRTDIYALGCMIYEMVTGRMPYEAQTVMALLSKHLTEPVVPPSQRRPDLALPPFLDELVLAAMQKDPARRPATMEAFGEQLAALLAQLPPDPTAHGGRTARASVAPPVETPVAFSVAAGQPPPPQLPQPVPAHVPQPPVRPAPPTSASSNKMLWIALVVFVLAGGGVTAYYATRSPKAATTTATTAATTTPEAPDPVVPRPPDPPPRPVDPPPSNNADPWRDTRDDGDGDGDGGGGGTPVPTQPTVGGARLETPPGFQRIYEGLDGQVIASPADGVRITLMPILTDDPADKLAREYAAAKGGKWKVAAMDSQLIHGADRPVAVLTDGAQFDFVVAFVSPRYRVALSIVAPLAAAENPQYLATLDNVIVQYLVLP